MNMRKWNWMLVALIMGACDGEDSADVEADSAANTENTQEEITDLRVPIPDPDPKFVDLIGPERIIKPGEDAMYCTHLTNDAGDLAVHYLDVMQGKFGHHVVLLATTDPKEHGTTEDCSSDAYMENVSAYVLPGTELPDGYAVNIPAGTKYILQSHYVNASLKSIRVRDIARMETLKPEEIKGWAATMTTNIRNFEVPADGKEYELTFDCIADQDMTLHLAGPHMHEWGTRFEFLAGPDADNLSSIVYVCIRGPVETGIPRSPADQPVPEQSDDNPQRVDITNHLHLRQYHRENVGFSGRNVFGLRIYS